MAKALAQSHAQVHVHAATQHSKGISTLVITPLGYILCETRNDWHAGVQEGGSVQLTPVMTTLIAVGLHLCAA